MAKNLLEDIKRVNKSSPKKSVASVPKEKRENFLGYLEHPKPSQPATEKFETKFASVYDTLEDKQKNGGSRYALWVVAVGAMVFLFFAVSFIFSRATVTIIPKAKEVNLNQDFSAVKDSNAVADLPFDLIVLSGEDSKRVQAEAEQDYNVKAKGTIVLYNAFGSMAQKLAINTKLEGSNGKIYTIDSKVVIPGQNIDGTPGSVEVNVSGMVAGEEYNTPPIDFKILGFKGTTKYAKFYGRSKGDIAGGLKGKSRQIADTEKIKAVSELQNSLKDKLFRKAINQIPSGYLLYQDAVFLNSDNESVGIASADGTASVNLKGTLYGFIFNEKKLTEKIVANIIPDFNGTDDVYISNIKDLKFSLDNQANVSFSDINDISFHLSGNPKVVWKFDGEKLIPDLLGKSKNDFNQILSQYPNISTATLDIRPIWKSSFPDKSKDIKIIVNYPQ